MRFFDTIISLKLLFELEWVKNTSSPQAVLSALISFCRCNGDGDFNLVGSVGLRWFRFALYRGIRKTILEDCRGSVHYENHEDEKKKHCSHPY